MGKKTNELPGTRAFLRSCRMSSYKVREVLDLIRGKSLRQALDILDHLDRQAAVVVAKLVRSAAANAEHNDMQDPDELYVATCFADEADTLKRWRPRARGRATRIRKRGSHITVILARMSPADISRMRAKEAAQAADMRARRVAGAKKAQGSETKEAALIATAKDSVDQVNETVDFTESEVSDVTASDVSLEETSQEGDVLEEDVVTESETSEQTASGDEEDKADEADAKEEEN